MSIVPLGTYTDLFFGSDDHTEHSYVITPNNDPSPARYYWSCIIGWTNPLGGYIGGGYYGMQTFGTGITGDKCVVFSIGDGAITAESSNPGAIISNDFDGGLGWSTRIPFTWAPDGDYRMRVYKGTTEVDGQWWNAEVTDLGTNVTTQISRIKVDPGWLGINGYSILFTERYAGAIDTCDDVEFVSADFTQLRANGTIAPVNTVSYYSAIGTCPNSNIVDITGGVRHVMGLDSSTLVDIDATFTTFPPDPNAGGAFTALYTFTPTVHFDPRESSYFHLVLNVNIPAEVLRAGAVATDATYRSRSVVNGTPGVWSAPTNIGLTRRAYRSVFFDWPINTVYQIEVTFIATSVAGTYGITADADWTDLTT